MPVPEGGEENLFSKLGKGVSFNRTSIESTGSMTIISFVVNESGEIEQKRIEREDFKGMNLPDQMFSVVESLKWTPGTCSGKAVPVLVRLPLRTCLR